MSSNWKAHGIKAHCPLHLWAAVKSMSEVCIGRVFCSPVTCFTLWINRILQTAFSICLILFSQIAIAEVVVAGQSIGKSEWKERVRLKSSQYKIEENFETTYKRGPALRIKGRVPAGGIQEAEFFYDENKTLVAAKVLAKNPEKFLQWLGKSSRAKRQPDNSYLFKDLRLRLEVDGDRKMVIVSSHDFDSRFQAQTSGNWLPSWRSIAIWGAACVAGIALIWILFRGRKRLWKYREPLSDYIVGITCVSAILWLFPEMQLGLTTYYLAAYLLGYGVLVSLALRTVRISGWLPRRVLVEHMWVVPMTPLLILPVIVRNVFKSAHYAGLILLLAELAAIFYWYVQPELLLALQIIPLAALVSGGIVRLYCLTYSLVGKGERHEALTVVATLLAWPFVLLGCVAILAFNVLVTCLLGVKAVLAPAFGLGLLGIVFEWHYLTLIAIGLAALGTLPGIAILLFSFSPTGYSMQNFSSDSFYPSMEGTFDFQNSSFVISDFDVNPANGMPMFGGLDVLGNPYGVDFTDTF